MADQGYEAPGWSRVEGTLMSAARSVRRLYDAAMAEIGLNLMEASTLAHLASAGQLTQVDLARRIGTGRARMGVYVDSLVARKAVQREADPADRRVWLVSLTPSGRELWLRSVEIDRIVRHCLRDGTTHDERVNLDQLLLRINENAINAADDELQVLIADALDGSVSASSTNAKRA
jgi:MarR family transcriptional regulator for hemolysin